MSVLTLDIVVRNRRECYTVTLMVDCGTESSTVTHLLLFLEIEIESRKTGAGLWYMATTTTNLFIVPKAEYYSYFTSC